MKNVIKVGIVGFGTVGAGTADNLLRNQEVIAKRTGVNVVLTAIADLDITTDRGVKVPQEILTTNVNELIEKCDVVVELVGGTTFAGDLILKALNAGKSVVTANKALLATRGPELFAAAEKNNVDLMYEASVAGGIPVIKALREGLSTNRIERIYGIMNGTCNYILTRMEAEGASFDSVLKDAQKLGYAEAEPSLDVDGFDTAHKATILASLAYGEWFGMAPVAVEGIRSITEFDMTMARELGYRFKLLAVIKACNGKILISVAPTLVPGASMLGNISGVFNGVMIEGEPVGRTLFYGRGAGREATASAVAADVVDAALNLKYNCLRRIPAFRNGVQHQGVLPMDEAFNRYYLRLNVCEQPGVMAAITRILGDKNISISSFTQKEQRSSESAGSVPMIIITHQAQEKCMRSAIEAIEALDVVLDKVQMFRIEDI